MQVASAANPAITRTASVPSKASPSPLADFGATLTATMSGSGRKEAGTTKALPKSATAGRKTTCCRACDETQPMPQPEKSSGVLLSDLANPLLPIPPPVLNAPDTTTKPDPTAAGAVETTAAAGQNATSQMDPKAIDPATVIPILAPALSAPDTIVRGRSAATVAVKSQAAQIVTSQMDPKLIVPATVLSEEVSPTDPGLQTEKQGSATSSIPVAASPVETEKVLLPLATSASGEEKLQLPPDLRPGASPDVLLRGPVAPGSSAVESAPVDPFSFHVLPVVDSASSEVPPQVHSTSSSFQVSSKSPISLPKVATCDARLLPTAMSMMGEVKLSSATEQSKGKQPPNPGTRLHTPSEQTPTMAPTPVGEIGEDGEQLVQGATSSEPAQTSGVAATNEIGEPVACAPESKVTVPALAARTPSSAPSAEARLDPAADPEKKILAAGREEKSSAAISPTAAQPHESSAGISPKVDAKEDVGARIAAVEAAPVATTHADPPPAPALPKVHQALDSAPPVAASSQPLARVIPGPGGELQMHLGIRTSAFGAVEIHTLVQQNQVGLAIHGERGLSHWFSSEVQTIESGLRDQRLNLATIEFDNNTAGLGTATSFHHDHSRRGASAMPSPGVALGDPCAEPESIDLQSEIPVQAATRVSIRI